jgi:hypothetical protein
LLANHGGYVILFVLVCVFVVHPTMCFAHATWPQFVPETSRLFGAKCSHTY